MADLATLLGRTFTPEQEAQAQALLEQASAVVRAYLRQHITRATTTDTFTMRRADPLLHRCGGVVTLPQRPVVGIDTVSVNEVETSDWWQDGSDLLLRSWAWDGPPVAHRPPQVTVTYTHGWEEVPGDIKAIVLQAANRVIVNPGGLRSETVGGESVTYLVPNGGEALGVLLSELEKRALRRYRPASGTVRLRSC
ncbi:hypothetical protein AQJ84_11115 [Streptomyces resistomycificus]|uniref:hypothetical protein n=1 Tax=Streptomyces resistomycificus TaxID=67356 RepID=UPI000691586D|nr:hypothetical protein [Streptomyces resistomycificus]KUN99490.1 hypothetical protein AQJ84_11115 [Streptomyces resistomycificus]